MSDYLFARPSFLEGMARVFDLGCTLNEYNRSMTPDQADNLALLADWMAVGVALSSAIQSAEESPEEVLGVLQAA